MIHIPRINVRSKLINVVLVLAFLMGFVPAHSVFANGSDSTFTNQLFLPLVSSESTFIPGLDSEEFQRFQQRVEQLMGEMDVAVLEDGSIQISTDFPTPPEDASENSLNAASIDEDTEFYRQVSTLVELVNTGQLQISFSEVTNSNNVQSANVIAPDFDWHNGDEWIIVTLHNGELTVIKWISGQIFGAFVGAIFGLFAGNGLGLTVGSVFGWFAGNYLEDYVLDAYIPEYFKFAIGKSQWQGKTLTSGDYPFYTFSYKEDSTSNCNNKWRRYIYNWFGKFTLDPNYCT